MRNIEISAHIDEQLNDCRGDDKNELDQQVCNVLEWEKTLCLSRYLARDHLESVKQCYKSTTGPARATCDEAVEALKKAVDATVDGLDEHFIVHDLEKEEREALSQCPSIAGAFSSQSANQAMQCVCLRLTPAAYATFAKCLTQHPNNPTECLKDQSTASLMMRLGKLYGKSKMLHLLR